MKPQFIARNMVLEQSYTTFQLRTQNVCQHTSLELAVVLVGNESENFSH